VEPRIWHESYPPGVPETLEAYPETSLFGILEVAAARFPENPALAFFGHHLDYRELLAEVEQCAAWLSALGVGRGDRVGLILPNCPQYVITYYAALRLGAIAVGNNPLYTQREMRHQLTDADCKVIVVLDQLYPAFGAIRGDLPGPDHVVVTRITEYMGMPLRLFAPLAFRREARKEGRPWPPVATADDVLWWDDVTSDDHQVPPVAEVDPRSDIAALVYTGGTTGIAKGAMLTHANLLANSHQAAAWFPEVREGEESLMCILPFFLSYGMTVEMNVGILIGAKLILIPRYDIDRVLNAIVKERPTFFPGIPRLYIAISEEAERRNVDLSSIQACLSGAAKLPQAVAERFESLTGGHVVEGYGLTEASPITHANPVLGRRKEGSFGLPVPSTDCRIVELEDATVEVAPGQTGELLISGPQVMAGYWNQRDETAKVRPDEWLHTGDIVRMDEDGYFFIVDRKKEMIIVSGRNVFPTQVEEVLYHHPKVARVAVIGVPDEVTGEAIKAFIVLRDGESATAEEILEWAADPVSGMAQYRLPRQIEFRDSLPENIAGKVLRRVLVEEEQAAAGEIGGRK